MNKQQQTLINVAGQKFNSYASLENQISLILRQYKEDETLKQQDFFFIIDVLKFHPNYYQSEVDKIKSIIVKRNPKEKQNSICFYFVSDDGQMKYFNYKNYLNEINKLQQQQISNGNQVTNLFQNKINSFTLTFFAVILMCIFQTIPNLIVKFQNFLENIKRYLGQLIGIKKKNYERIAQFLIQKQKDRRN